MKNLLFLVIHSGMIFCQSEIYTNTELGISFDYSETDYSPFGLVYDSARTNSMQGWNNFTSNAVGISFKGTFLLIIKINIFSTKMIQKTGDMI